MSATPLSFDVGSFPAMNSSLERVSKEAKDGNRLNLRLPEVGKQKQRGDEEEKKAAVQMEKPEQVSEKLLDSGLEFSFDQETGQTIIKMYDRRTGEVVRQLPAEETLAFLKRLAAQEEGKGVLVSKKL